MSYFMITKGQKPDFSGIDKVEAIPIDEAQLYLSRLATDLAEDGDVSNLYFVSDGETGTSDNFISEAEGLFFRTNSFTGTRLDQVIDACAEAGNSFRIWSPVSPTAHLDVKWFDAIDFLKKVIANQILYLQPGRGISVGYIPIISTGKAARSTT